MNTTTATVQVEKSTLGWSGTPRYGKQGRTTRPFAVKVNGLILKTEADQIRTFADHAKAQAAGCEAALVACGAERLKAEDANGDTRTGWFLDGVWLAPTNDTKAALAAITGN